MPVFPQQSCVDIKVEANIRGGLGPSSASPDKMSNVSQRATSRSEAAATPRAHLSVDKAKDSAVADSDYASDADTAENRPDKP